MILVVGGLLTFTLAFYISFILYMILNLNFKKNIHIFMIIISFFTIFYLSSTSGKIFFDDMIINRLSISEDSNRIIRGDNRTYNMAIGMEKVLEKPLMGYGYSARLRGLGFELSSIVGTLATYGFIGVLCALLPFFLVSFYSYKNKELFMFVPIVALNFIPRGPGFGGLLMLLIFYGIYQECSGFRNRERNAQLQGHR